MSGRWWSIHGSRGWWFDVKEELDYRRMVEAAGWNPSHMVVARSFWQRLRGLLGSDFSDDRPLGPVVFPNCSSVHTFGMRRRIDIVFLDADCRVLLRCENVGPCRILSHRDAVVVIERMHDVDGASVGASGTAI